MTARTIDLSGLYTVASVTATDLVLTDPASVNPNWAYVDLAGDGTTGYAQNISIIRPPLYQINDLSGSGYTVASVTTTRINLTDPGAVSSDWNRLGGLLGFATGLLSANISTINNANWIGPFIVEANDTALLIANFVALSGLYKDSGSKQSAFPITIQLESTHVDLADTPVASPEVFTTTVPGNSTGRDLRAATLICQLAHPGRQSVRARRTTNADLNFKGTVVDEVKWQDLYGVGPVPVPDFGNVTTVHSRTYATEGALSVKDRKLNMLATRRVPIWTGGTSFSAPAPTKSAADIFTAICLDPYIGRRQLSELDLDSIYGAVAASVSYFGLPDAGQFSYTFDDDNISFQETAAVVAAAAFSTSFRQGSLIKMQLEKATEDSVLLFNHRNKLPGSETRTVRFGNLNDNDGVEVEYTDPVTDAPITFYLPADRSAVNPSAIKALGVRSRPQVYWTAWRAYNKIRYQNTATEFTALQEAAAIARNERALIADNTRPETQDGEISAQSGLELTVSQPIVFAGGVSYTIFIQLADGSIDSMAVSAGSSAHKVLIARAPRLALVFGDDLYALPTYQIVRNDSPRPDAFLISQRQPGDNLTYSVQAVNYSPMYYANDQLVVWLPFVGNYLDAGPLLHDAAPIGASAIANDGTRAKVHVGGGGGDLVALPAFAAPAAYTKAFWARRNNVGGGGSILSSTGGDERLAFSGAAVQVFHSGALALAAAWPGVAGEWHHVAVTFDPTHGDMAIFIDGEAAAATTGVAQRTLGALHAVGYAGGDGLAGAVDDLRLLARALFGAEVRALFRATRV